MDNYIGVLKKYAVFEGRARRREYWMFVLFSAIISIIVSFIDMFLSLSGNKIFNLSNLYSLAIIVPSIAVGVRRMHDSNHSGWWIILPIVNFVFACFDSTPGENKYGPNPKGVPAVANTPDVNSTV